jgi:FtsP/CotA-like multicopper oxidase with cupredoxin domain
MKRVLKAVTKSTFALCAAGVLVAAPGHAAVPGIAGPTFNLQAAPGLSSQPDGANVYSWGYGCTSTPGFKPAGISNARCPSMQLPGPTLIVNEGDTVTVNLANNLPALAGNTSIVFPGFQVCAATLNADGTCTGAMSGAAGSLTQEAATGGTVTYTFKATKPGTYAYYSGTQPELQVEMGLFGALIVLPGTPPTACSNRAVPTSAYSGDMRLSSAAYNNDATCYDREYLFQFSEMNSRVHQQVLEQVQACGSSTSCAPLAVAIEPFRPNYFLINGRSMPDIMDTSYAAGYPSQPYNGNPQMHPGELVLMRIIGQGRWQHPFHFHGNHARVIARDGNLLLSARDASPTTSTPLAGPLLFTTPTVPGQSQDQIFSWTGKGLNWDVYNHVLNDGSNCTPDANGFHSVKTDANYGEWCADHNRPIPVTPPDPQIVANGQWYGGSPYLGLQGFDPTKLPPGTLNQNPGAGYAYMWHSHNEREITTNDVFPGGMMMMLIINAPQWTIDESQ